MKEILYIQNMITIYKNDYVIIDKDLSNLFLIDIKKIIKKYKRLFNNNYCYKIRDNYLIKKDGVVLLSLLIYSYYIKEIVDLVLYIFDLLKNIDEYGLNKIKQIE